MDSGRLLCTTAVLRKSCGLKAAGRGAGCSSTNKEESSMMGLDDGSLAAGSFAISAF